MSKDAIILTVYNRPLAVLKAVLRQLAKADMADTTVIIMDDGSSAAYREKYAALFDDGMFCDLNIQWVAADTVRGFPGAYHINGHNNPAYVNNLAIKAAAGCDRIFFLSSDTLIPPHALSLARDTVDSGAVFVPTVMDIDTSTVWNSPSSVWPMMWFVGASYGAVVECGGFDEEFCKGMAFEDNDFMGRLVLQAGEILVHGGCVALHQTHAQVAYSDELEGFRRSEAYCLEKWDGAIPWRENGNPFTWRGAVNQGVARFRVERVVYA